MRVFCFQPPTTPTPEASIPPLEPGVVTGPRVSENRISEGVRKCLTFVVFIKSRTFSKFENFAQDWVKFAQKLFHSKFSHPRPLPSDLSFCPIPAPPGGSQRAVCWEYERDQWCRLHVLSSGPGGRAPWYIQVRHTQPAQIHPILPAKSVRHTQPVKIHPMFCPQGRL